MWKLKLNLEKVADILDAYTNVSTIAGVVYINKSQTRFTRTFWLMWIILLLSLAFYSSAVVYISWLQNPVSTSVDSTGIPLTSFPFPGIVFCTEGKMLSPYVRSFYKQAEKLIKQFGGENANTSVLDIEIFMLSAVKVSNGSTILDLLMPGTGFIEFYSMYHMVDEFYIFSSRDPVAHQKSSNRYGPVAYSNYLLDFLFPTPKTKITNPLKEFGWKLALHKIRYIFSELFSHIWYLRVPCFDMAHLTVVNNSEDSFMWNINNKARRAFLRECKWRGMNVPCSAVFETVATDMGLCCGFNMLNAESQFTESMYLKKMIELQSQDKSISFESSTVPAWYVKQNQPKSRYGSKMGLQVKLDTHQNLLAGLSSTTNFQSITGLILQKSDFPLVRANGFPIVQGHQNLISMSGIIINGDNSLRSIAPSHRQCLFHNENELKLFKMYSQANCLFECNIHHTQIMMMSLEANMTTPCTPWYFPFNEKENLLCDPFQRKVFDDIFNSMSKSCEKCSPDCNAYIYKHSLALEPFRDCDDFNLMLTPQCNLRDTGKEKSPFLFGDQINDQLETTKKHFTILAKNISKYRKNAFEYSNSQSILKSTFDRYNAFDKDISVVSIFFDDTTVWKFSTRASSNWTLYFSSVGGSLGLMIALSICTLVELLWLLYQVMSAYFSCIRTERLVSNNDK